MHLKCCSPGNASRHMQATCVRTQACTHMQAHVLTCVNCKRTARRQKPYAFFILCIHCTRAQSTDDNHGHLRVINDILIASLPGSSPTGRPHAGRDALRHPEMLAMGSKPRNSLPDIQNLAKELIAAKCASAMQSGPAAQCCPTLLRFSTAIEP